MKLCRCILCVYLSAPFSIALQACLSICPSVYRSNLMFVCMSIPKCQSLYMRSRDLMDRTYDFTLICLSIYLFICLSLYKHVCLSVCMSVIPVYEYEKQRLVGLELWRHCVLFTQFLSRLIKYTTHFILSYSNLLIIPWIRYFLFLRN